MDWLDWDEPRIEPSRKIDIIRDAIAARKWALIGAPLAALVLVALCLLLATPKYRAEAQVLIGGKSNPTVLVGDADRFATVTDEARLIASRDLARRAIKELGIEAKPEFDPLAEGLQPAARVLILLGLTRDPARMSLEERVLKSYQDRLSVSPPHGDGVVTIAFQSEDRDLAALAANRIADLYLEMRADAKLAGAGDSAARIITRAVAPRRRIYPDHASLLVAGASAAFAAFIVALAACVASPLRFAPLRPLSRAPIRASIKDAVEKPIQQPRAIGQAAVFARLKAPDRRHRQNPTASRAEADNAQALAAIAGRILSKRRSSRGARIVVTGLTTAGAAPGMTLALGRLLGREGRSIVVFLDKASRLDFGESVVAPRGEKGLGDLLSGRASFAEVICLDPASRLHFVPHGPVGPIDLGELANVLEALTRTYDFIWLLAPPFDQDNMAKMLAAQADFVVFEAPPPPHEGAACKAQAELFECGAQEVLVIGAPARLHRNLGQDAA